MMFCDFLDRYIIDSVAKSVFSNHVAVWMVEPSTKFGVRIKAHIRRLVGKMDNKAPSRVGGTLNGFVHFENVGSEDVRSRKGDYFEALRAPGTNHANYRIVANR